MVLMGLSTVVLGKIKKNKYKEKIEHELNLPPRPIVTLILPAFLRCFSSLNASGCESSGYTTKWYQGNNIYASGPSIIVNSSIAVILKATCYDSSTGSNGFFSPEYKAVPATYSLIKPYNPSFCTGGSIDLEDSSGAGLNYQWKKNGVNISGANNRGFVATEAGTYTVENSNAAGCTSICSPVIVTIVPPNIPVITPVVYGTCGYRSLTMSTQLLPNGSFVWKRDGYPVFSTSGTGSSYSILGTGTFTVDYTSNGCTVTSAPYQFIEPISPTIALVRPTPPSCSSYLKATGCLGTVKWYSYSAGIWSYKYSGSSYTFPVSTNLITYRATCSANSCESNQSNSIVAIPNNYVSIIANTSVICDTESIVLGTNSSSLSSYQWQYNNVNILGATANTYETALLGNYRVVASSNSCSFTSADFTISKVIGTINSVNSGYWNDPYVWSCNCIPALCSDIIINSSHTIFMSTSLSGHLKNLTLQGTIQATNLSSLNFKK